MNIFQRGIDALRQPDRNPRCYEMTDEERSNKIQEWNRRNVWNEPELAKQDELAKQTYYGA